MAGNVLEFDDQSFQAEVLDSSQPVLVDFWAEWCGPCKMLAPTIEELADEFSGRAKIGKLNTDKSPETASGHGISSIPTVILFKNGEVVDKFVGVTPKDTFVAALDKNL